MIHALNYMPHSIPSSALAQPQIMACLDRGLYLTWHPHPCCLITLSMEYVVHIFSCQKYIQTVLRKFESESLGDIRGLWRSHPRRPWSMYPSDATLFTGAAVSIEEPIQSVSQCPETSPALWTSSSGAMPRCLGPLSRPRHPPYSARPTAPPFQQPRSAR